MTLAAQPLSSVLHDVEQFLRHEAWLLDDLRFEDWEQLLAPEIRYRVPIRRNLTDPTLQARPDALTGTGELNHFDEDAESIRVRLTRLRSGAAWSEDPPSRTRRLIGNVVVTPTGTDDELDVRSAFLLHRVRMDREIEMFAGERRDRLRRTSTDAGFAIVSRVVLLDHTLIHANDLGIFF